MTTQTTTETTPEPTTEAAAGSRLLAQLHGGARELSLPAALSLPGEISRLHLTQVLRLLPGQRLVARGTMGLTNVVAKLYVGPKAKRHQQRERAGAAALSQVPTKTAQLLAEGQIEQTTLNPHGPLCYLLYRELSATPLATDPSLAEFLACIDTVAALHNANLVQTDMHLGNFLHAPEGVYAIDADGIRQTLSLPRTNALTNLAVLFAQRHPQVQRQELAAWVERYQTARAWPATPVQPAADLVTEMAVLTQRQRAQRVRRYLVKSLRDCTEFVAQTSRHQRFVARRDQMSSDLQAFADNPTALMDAGKVLKPGNTATVVRTRMGDRDVIVKRYNVKHRRHQLGQSLHFRSRACRAWRNGLLLEFLGIPTARPIALLETRQGPLRSTAYLVQEDLGSVDLLQLVKSPQDLAPLAPQIRELFATLQQLGLVHGDTKATNFIVRDDQVYLIDLDSLHRTPSWQTGLPQLNSPGIDKDRMRFVRNWVEQPAVAEAVTELFEKLRPQ